MEASMKRILIALSLAVVAIMVIVAPVLAAAGGKGGI
jgi:hypothetical protein